MGSRSPFKVEIAKATQVLALDAPPDRAVHVGEANFKARPPIQGRAMMPASLVAHKAKVFDDGLLAAVEMAADEGCGKLAGRVPLLRRWLAQSKSEHLQLALDLRAGEREGSLTDTPISFYTWTTPLERIFRSDRSLQRPLDAGEANELWNTLAECGGREDYSAQLRLWARLTNPFADKSLGQGGEMAIFPASGSIENSLMQKLLESGNLPADFDPVEELRVRLEKGTISLQPDEKSGWYRHCQWCLESLVHDRDNLERDKLVRKPGYQQCLNELFRALFGLTRETHIKQMKGFVLSLPYGEPRPKVSVKPSLRIEPLVTYYLRRAQSYQFVLGVLEQSLGNPGLSQLRRLTPQGAVESPLDHEIAWMVKLFHGLAQLAADDLGLEIQVGSSSTALDWLKHWHSDPDLGQDIRCMVPLYYDPARAQYRVQAIVGYTSKPLEISFASPPEVIVRNSNDEPVDADLIFESQRENLVYPVTTQFYISQLIEREHFRALCNDHTNLSNLRQALSIV